jgi:hypothetical protein
MISQILPNMRFVRRFLTMSLVEEWIALSADVRHVGLRIFETADVPVTMKGFADEKVLALTLLARTVSNVKSTLLLLDAKRIVEARTIARSCLENFFWTVGLAEEGEAFVRKMRNDEMSHRRAQGQSIFSNDIQLEETVKQRLQAFMRDSGRQFGDAKTLSPKQVARIREDFQKTYIFYGHLSADAHPSVMTLNRYVVPHTVDEIGGIDVDPVVNDPEIAETLEYLCMAATGVCVGVNQMLGGTDGGKALDAIATRYTDLSNRTKTQSALTDDLDHQHVDGARDKPSPRA